MDSPRSAGEKDDSVAVAPTPRKLSDLLTAFGAAPSPASASRMRKVVHHETSLADPSPNWTPSSDGNQLRSLATPQHLQQNSSTDAESISSGDVIHGIILRFKQNNERLLTIE
jgi:hypothetical protein